MELQRPERRIMTAYRMLAKCVIRCVRRQGDAWERLGIVKTVCVPVAAVDVNPLRRFWHDAEQ
jgi:hypothetical protein